RRCGRESGAPRSRSGRGGRSVPSRGTGPFGLHQPGDVGQRIEVVDAGLVRAQLDPECLFEMSHQLDRGEGIEDSAGDEGGLVGQFVRRLPREELLEDEILDVVADGVHRAERSWIGDLQAKKCAPDDTRNRARSAAPVAADGPPKSSRYGESYARRL